MITYLDTQIVVWLINGQSEKLTIVANEMLERSSLLISPMVLLELEFLFEKKRAFQPASHVMDKLRSELHVEVCPLPFPSVAHTALSEKWTRDPFDRLIVAHARANRMAPLISSDRQIRQNYPGTVWAD